MSSQRVRHCFGIHNWPILTSGWFTLTFVTSYLISTLNGHVYNFFPFISDTGTLPPESSIFGLLLTFASIFLYITTYIRYRQVDMCINAYGMNLSKTWNSVARACAILTCFGTILVANFPQFSVLEVHVVGAAMSFGIGSLYFILQFSNFAMCLNKVGAYLSLHHWPILTAAWFAFTFVTSFLVSTLDGHVYIFFPYISDTGTKPPESCIFGQLLNICAIFLFITMYIRHRQVDMGIDAFEIELDRRWNKASRICGILACLGTTFVANFQQTAVGLMHFLGAFLAFGIGSIYFIIQTRISFAFRGAYNKNIDVGVSSGLLAFRLFLSVFLLPLFFVNLSCSIISGTQFDGDDILQWKEENAGFDTRMAAVFTEWILAIFIVLYLLTFTKEFKALKFKEVGFQSTVYD